MITHFQGIRKHKILKRKHGKTFATAVEAGKKVTVDVKSFQSLRSRVSKKPGQDRYLRRSETRVHWKLE
jgi:hypothetical protein